MKEIAGQGLGRPRIAAAEAAAALRSYRWPGPCAGSLSLGAAKSGQGPRLVRPRQQR